MKKKIILIIALVLVIGLGIFLGVKLATKKVEGIILAERCRVDRIEEVFLNNPEEKLHEELMDKEFIN